MDMDMDEDIELVEHQLWLDLVGAVVSHWRRGDQAQGLGAMAILGYEAQTWKEGLLVSHLLAFTASAYVYYILRRLPAGLPRLVAAVPVLALYAILPLIFNRATHLVGLATLCCILTWLASFKLLLLCWRRGPGCDPWVANSFLRFAVVMTYPAHAKRAETVVKTVRAEESGGLWSQVSTSETWFMLVVRSAAKAVALAVDLRLLLMRDVLPAVLIHLLVTVQLYLFVTIVLEVLAAVAVAAFGITIEPHFDNPLAAASLAEFWGRRWNLLVSNILRETVYNPILEVARVSGSRNSEKGLDVAKLVAMLAAFTVSGVMHELVVFYTTLEVEWRMTSFFVVQGVAVGLEAAWKVRFPHAKLPRVVATAATLAFAFVTAHWLFWPPLDGGSEQVAMEMRRMLQGR